MSRFSYVNGRYIPHHLATTPIEDRGYQFADGVYEVIALRDGRLIDRDAHLDRLDFSLKELRISPPYPSFSLIHKIQVLLEKNRLSHGMVYLQITRGVAPRSHEFPRNSPPTVVITCRYVCPDKRKALQTKGVKLITRPDIRWQRPDIKSISLLPNVLAKQEALDKDAYETLFINAKKNVTETSSTNFWIIREDGTLQTHPPSQDILNGITRQRLITLATSSLGGKVKEDPFTLTEVFQAKEAFLSSSIAGILPVFYIDGRPIGNGTLGKGVSELIQKYEEFTKS